MLAIKHRSPISGIATYKNKYVATAGYDNQLILWDAKSGAPLAKAEHEHLVNQCRFSPDGQYLASVSSDYTAKLWRLPNLELVTSFEKHTDDVEMAVFHPSLPLIATASRDFSARVFDFDGVEKQALIGHQLDVSSVEWSQDGTHLFTSSDDGSIREWDYETGKEVKRHSSGDTETDTLVVTSNGDLFAGDDDGELTWIRGDKTTKVKAHRSGVKRVVYCPETQRLISLSYDRSFRIYDVSEAGQFKLIKKDEFPSEIWARSCAILNDNEIVFASFGSSYATYDISQSAWDLSRVEPTPGVNAVSEGALGQLTIGDAGIVQRNGVKLSTPGSLCNFIIQVGNYAYTGGQTGEVFDALTGKPIYQHHSPLNCAASFKRNGQTHLIIGSYTGEGITFEVGPREQLKFLTALPLHTNAVKGLAANRTNIFSVSANYEATFTSIKSLQVQKRIAKAHDRVANACATLGDTEFVSVSRDKKLRLWKDKQSLVIPTPHTHSIKSLATSARRFVATGSYHGDVHIYDTETKMWIHSERPTHAGISCLSPTADPVVFLASAYDGKVYPVRLDINLQPTRRVA